MGAILESKVKEGQAMGCFVLRLGATVLTLIE